MMTYIATFYSHYGAIQFRKSSCGTCVQFEADGIFPDSTEETEQIVRVEEKGYVSIYQADEE